MKILLINPSITKSQVYAKYAAGAPSLPPLGLCYLAAVLLEKGYETRILDCAVEQWSISRLRNEIVRFKPNLVGVTSTTVSYPAARATLQAIKELDPEIKTVLGGAHISALPIETMLDCEEADIGVFGEGEKTLLEIVEGTASNKELHQVQGTLYRENGKVRMSQPRKPTKPLDDLPFPARHLLKDLRRYSHTPFRGTNFMTTMITSRGCPFKCAYCDQSVYGRTWRYHSAEYVLREIEHLKQSYGIDFITFEDDNFLLSKDRITEICQKMLASSVNIGWTCSGRVTEVDDELLPLMKDAGCKTIYIGIESGSPRILELLNKHITMDQIRSGVRLIKKYGISVYGSFILGIPSETKKDIKNSIDFALSLPLDGASFFIFTPFPNTPLRELAFQHGKVSMLWQDYSGHPTSLPFIPRGMDEGYLLKAQTQAYKRFLLRPSYLIKHLGTFSNRRTLEKGVKFLRSLFRT